jgi:hypothetical protein
VGIAVSAMLAVAATCLAQEPTQPAAQEPSGMIPGRGAIGGLVGGSYFFADADYTTGALPRFAFAGNLRYVASRSWRIQVSPGFTWAGYGNDHPMPFVDARYPGDVTKADVLTLLVPISTQLQYVRATGGWFLHAGAGPGLYRVLVENRRDVILDPQTFRPHRGLYLGGSAQVGVERFLKSLPNTNVELYFSLNRGKKKGPDLPLPGSSR